MGNTSSIFVQHVLLLRFNTAPTSSTTDFEKYACFYDQGGDTTIMYGMPIKAGVVGERVNSLTLETKSSHHLSPPSYQSTISGVLVDIYPLALSQDLTDVCVNQIYYEAFTPGNGAILRISVPYAECEAASNCKYCWYDNICSDCLSGYYLNSSKACPHCPDPCLQCTAVDSCQVCDNGYFVNNGVCDNCEENCQNCDSEVLCTTCESSYFLYNGNCTDNCSAYGSYYNDDSVVPQKCSDCESRCLACEDNIECTKCENPYFLIQGTCFEKCEDAGQFEKGGICVEDCGVDYYESSGYCLLCSNFILNCIECIVNITYINGLCTKCEDGYDLQGENKCLFNTDTDDSDDSDDTDSDTSDTDDTGSSVIGTQPDVGGIVGGVLGALFGVILILVIAAAVCLILFYFWKKNKDSKNKESNVELEPKEEVEDKDDEKEEEEKKEGEKSSSSSSSDEEKNKE